MKVMNSRVQRSTLVIALSALALCGACRSPRGIEFEIHSLEKTAGDCAEDGAGPCASFRVEYPEITVAPTDALKQRLNEAIRELLLSPLLLAAEPDGPEAMGSQFIDSWVATRKEFPEAASVARWYAEHRVSVIWRDAALISFESAEEAYSGGAHPNTASRYASFALSDGRALTLDELFNPGFRSRLNEIAERFFREARQIPAEKSLADAGFWFDDGFEVNDNFAVVEAGLLFFFDAYEIGPYSAGPTRMVIPRQALGDLVPAGSPLALQAASSPVAGLFITRRTM